MPEEMSFEELEQVYELLAVTIDVVGETQERLFLCKLALALANDLGSFTAFQTALATARQDLDV